MSLGGYSGAMNPFTSPYAVPYTGYTQGISPFGQQGYSGFTGYSPIAQQQQLQQLQQLQHLQQIQQLQTLASILASQQGNPWQMQQPGLLQNPLIAATLQNPLLTQHLLQQQNPLAQSGFPLAPQSWIGQQIHPQHQQFSGRGIY